MISLITLKKYNQHTATHLHFRIMVIPGLRQIPSSHLIPLIRSLLSLHSSTDNLLVGPLAHILPLAPLNLWTPRPHHLWRLTTLAVLLLLYLPVLGEATRLLVRTTDAQTLCLPNPMYPRSLTIDPPLPLAQPRRQSSTYPQSL